LPHTDKLKFLGDEHALVAHVTVMREEVEPVAEVAAVTEPEVAKKGKQDSAEGGAAEAASAADKGKK
jgi:large subunit ribosomal protein L25